MNSKKQLSNPILYLDVNFGRYITPKILKENNILFKLHTDYLPQDAADEEWIMLCARKNWIALTLDNRLIYNTAVRLAAKNTSIAIFCLPTSNMTGEVTAKLIVESYTKIINFYKGNKKPFLANVSKHGKIMLAKKFI